MRAASFLAVVYLNLWLVCLAVGTLLTGVGFILLVREARRAPICQHARETMDATELRIGWLVYRCLDCGRMRELGCALSTGTNRQRRRAS